ncbi:aldo/keto reductase [Candidatus Marsarchaeota archaeon]|jgi:diketogulonate reductase-like aldo/keto reductase|nr:aldo/keto reductase [Candidatus Marsarchaeota archaeon]
MDKIKLGRTDEKIPKIGIGTWKMPADSKEAEVAIKFAIHHGMDFVDTAEIYANETMVGRAIRGEKTFIATKVPPHKFRYEDVLKACDASLKKLGVKQIDLYQLHWPNHSIPISETMKAMEELKKAGKIRYIGVSNFDVAELENAQAALKNDEIVSNQIEYSILVREVEKDMLGYARENKITIIAYSPLARASLFSPKYKELMALLSRIGHQHGKSAVQVALNWVLRDGNTIAIPKATSIAHVEENCGAAGWSLSAVELAEVNDFLLGIRKRPISSIFTKMLKHNGLWSKVASKISK